MSCLIKLATSKQRNALRKSLRIYLTTDEEKIGSIRMQNWPLVERVEIEVPNVDILRNGIHLCDLPGIEVDSKARSARTKEVGMGSRLKFM